MPQIIYKVTSAYPPALTHHPMGGRMIVAGSIQSIEVGAVRIPASTRLPESTSMAQLVWVKPEPAQIVSPSTRTVQGSGGKTYTITTLATGRQTCTCPGFSYRRTCKHIGA